MRKTVFLVIFLFTLYNAHAQKEANIWYFGFYAGLDFNNGDPVALTDGQTETMEGCATISNSDGKLLFYTDGVTVWDKTHKVMPNGTGLLGHYSSTQSSIIVPKPNSPYVFYIFTTDAYENNNENGVRYSEVDMSLNGGLGDISTVKNILLYSPSAEKLTATKKSDGSGYWILTHGYLNDEFVAYSVTDIGINSIPVISKAGPKTISVNSYLKFSPDGSKIINANGYYETAIFDFDSSSGIVTNHIPIDFYMAYGAEFSPSGKILYISSPEQVVQYDLNAINISDSKITLYKYDGAENLVTTQALQLGSNGKIYGAVNEKHFLSAINKPDILGIGCEFQPEAVHLNTGMSFFGLPQFIQSYFDLSFNAKKICLGDITEFSLTDYQGVSSVSWDFGDGFFSTDLKPNHTYTALGKHTVTVTTLSASGTSTKKKEIIIFPVPKSVKPEDLLQCDDNNDGFYTFDLTNQNTDILNGQDPYLFGINYFVNGTAIVLPNAYTNIIAYGEEIITAEVYNKANGDCKSTTSFNIDVFDTPKPSLPVNIPALTGCDNTTAGTDTDGKILSDLTLREADILNGQPAAQFLVSYYKDEGFTQLIAAPKTYQNTNAVESIFVKVVNKDNAQCIASTSFKLEVFSLPVVANTVNLKQCDDDIDGFSFFNLEEAIAKITAYSAAETITFHKSLAEAQNNSNAILDKTAYRNQIASSDKIYVRVANNNNCHSVAQLNLIVSTTQIPPTYSKVFTQCDDEISGTDKDGIASFDFSAVTSDIQRIFPSGQLLDISYYQNIEDALSEKNAIADISNYRNTASPNTQKIFIRVDSRLNNDCLGLGGYITLKVESIPVVESIKRVHCDDNHDGLYAFDTSNLEQELLNGLTNVSVSYVDHNNSPLPSPLPNPFITNSQIIKVIVTNNTPALCRFDSTITFVVDNLPEAFAIDPSMTTVCDDESDPALQDGNYAFDTSTFEDHLLGTQTGMTVNYYDSNNNPLPSPLPNPFVTSSQNVKVEVINPNNTTCTGSTVIAFVVNPVPKINLSGQELVCSNLPTFTKQIDAGLLDMNVMNDYNYQWFFNGDLIPTETNYNLTVNKEGNFTVQVSDKQTQCIRTRTVKVSASDIASNIITLVDESNTISVSVTGNGDYLYALDDQNGYYQNENTFLNVRAGIHIVYIKDQNGCGTVSKEVAVFGIPKFFTPNQDSHHDYWNVEGIEEVSNSKTTIQIFDRYGKLLKQISPMSQGWDGTYLGTNMPADDYWYVIKLEDNRVFKGHFALKR